MKRIMSVALSIVLLWGLLAIPAFAAESQGGYSLGVSGGSTALGSYSLGSEVRPGDDASFYIFIDGRHAQRQNIRADKIDVKRKASEGSRAVENVSIKYDKNGYAYIKVEFTDPFVSTKELDFAFTLYLTSSKSRLSGTELEVTGTLENHEQFVDENDDYFNMSDCPVIEAEAYVKAIELEVGDGLYIHAKLFSGKRYYAHVTQEIAAADDDILNKYPAIDTIYYLQTVNLKSSGNYIRFDVDGKQYVYNAELAYIGTTADKLPYSTKYYLASAELDLEDGGNIDTIPNETPSENVPGGGDDVPPNYNENPGTGR